MSIDIAIFFLLLQAGCLFAGWALQWTLFRLPIIALVLADRALQRLFPPRLESL